MATFLENFRNTSPEWQKPAPLSGTLGPRFYNPNDKPSMSKEDVEILRSEERIRNEQERLKRSEQMSRARNGNLTIAQNGNGAIRITQDWPVDISVSKNFDILNSMASEFGETKTFEDRQNVLKKYYNMLEDKTPLLSSMMDYFVGINKDAEDYAKHFNTEVDSQAMANYMRKIFMSAKERYTPKKI